MNDKLIDLTDEEVTRVAKECGFTILGIKHFEEDRIYYLKEEDTHD